MKADEIAVAEVEGVSMDDVADLVCRELGIERPRKREPDAER